MAFKPIRPTPQTVQTTRTTQSNTTIFTSKNEPIEWMTKSHTHYVDRNTLLFGGTDSGKSTLIFEILNLVKDYIPNYYIVCPETSAHQYSDKVDSRCIKEDFTKEKLEKIWQRQTLVTQLYNVANNINILESLFVKSKDDSIYREVRLIKSKLENKKTNIEQDSTIDFAQKKIQKTSIENLANTKLVSCYKTAIKRNYKYLQENIGNLTNEEKVALEYMDLNPRLMIVVDDRTENLATWYKYFKTGENNIFECIFFRGRWNYITCVIAAHDDKPMDTKIRKNARNIFYTQKQILNASMSKLSNGISAAERKVAERVGERIFGVVGPNGEKTHLKCCYVRSDANPWKYTIADIYPDFTLGCKATSELISKIHVNKNDKIDNNPYVNKICSSKPVKKIEQEPTIYDLYANYF